MFKITRQFFAVLLSVILISSCAKKIDKKDIEESLKTAMDQYLNHQPRMDTSKVKFNVLQVAYFEDKLVYICNFKVNMKAKETNRLVDTTGSMAARISKDFKTVSRTN